MIKEITITGKDPLAYTDFTAIYLSRYLLDKDLVVTRKHELSHIWLQHNTRGQAVKDLYKEVDMLILNIAADMEIAKHIYTIEDEEVFSYPRTLLGNCIKKQDCMKYPDCVYMEDFYAELIKDKENIKNELGKILSDIREEDLEQAKVKIDVSEVVDNAKKELQEDAEKTQRDRNLQKLQSRVNQFKIKPSLGSEIDRYLGRYARTTTRSYKRPNRRDSDFMQKGYAVQLKSPRLVVYQDRSGSFDATKTLSANKELSRLLAKYRGRVKRDVLYFNDDLFEADPINGSGGTNYQVVVDDLLKQKSNLAIIITDNDSADGLIINKKIPKVLVVCVGCDSSDIARKLNCQELRI